MKAEARLAELKLEPPPAPTPVAFTSLSARCRAISRWKSRRFLNFLRRSATKFMQQPAALEWCAAAFSKPAVPGKLTCSAFLCASLLATSFLSGCETAGGKGATKRNGSSVEARVAELKLELPAPTKPSATLRPAVTVGNL